MGINTAKGLYKRPTEKVGVGWGAWRDLRKQERKKKGNRCLHVGNGEQTQDEISGVGLGPILHGGLCALGGLLLHQHRDQNLEAQCQVTRDFRVMVCPSIVAGRGTTSQ